jgi:hypothetical protein
VSLAVAAWTLLAAAAAQEPVPTPEPPAVDEEDGDDEEPVPPAPLLDRRRLRRERQRALWEGEAPPLEADFLQRHTDLKLRVAFDGTSPGPFSLLTAFAGWNEAGLVVDHGVTTWRDFTIGLGGAAWFGYGLVASITSGRIADYEDHAFGWRMWDTGGVLRATAHWTRLSGVDPYLVGALGAGAFHLDAAARDLPTAPRQAVTNPYVRVELGGGLGWRIRPSTHWTVGIELRYQVTAQIGARDRFVFGTPEDPEVFVFAPLHRPPKGFTWAVQAGYRF